MCEQYVRVCMCRDEEQFNSRLIPRLLSELEYNYMYYYMTEYGLCTICSSSE